MAGGGLLPPGWLCHPVVHFWDFRFLHSSQHSSGSAFEMSDMQMALQKEGWKYSPCFHSTSRIHLPLTQRQYVPGDCGAVVLKAKHGGFHSYGFRSASVLHSVLMSNIPCLIPPCSEKLPVTWMLQLWTSLERGVVIFFGGFGSHSGEGLFG